jgi:urea transport system permease protein
MIELKDLTGLHTRRGWALFAGLALIGLVLIPLLNGAVPAGSPLHLPDHMIMLLGKFACFATAAVAMDLIWGFTGILSLGHGVFFALGGYAMGMYLMLAIGAQGVYRSNLPDFMVFLDWKELPWFWRPFDNFFFALACTVLVPGALAYVFGYFAFRSRIRGVYLSIITQALTFAMMLLFFRNETGQQRPHELQATLRLLSQSAVDAGRPVRACDRLPSACLHAVPLHR